MYTCQNDYLKHTKTKKNMKKVLSLLCAALVMLSASATTELSTRLPEKNAKLPELSQPIPTFDHNRIIPANIVATKKAPAAINDGKIVADYAQVMFYTASLNESRIAEYEFAFFQGDDFAAYVVVEANADSSKIAGTYNTLLEGRVLVAKGDTTNVESGSLTISYDNTSKKYQFVMSATCANKQIYTLDIAILANEVIAMDYMAYIMYQWGLGGNPYIELQDAPFEPTGKTIEVIFRGASKCTDNTASTTEPWVEFMGTKGDTIALIDIPTTNMIGTFGKADIDYEYTAISFDGGNTIIKSKEYDSNTITVSKSADTIVVDASIMFKDGNIYHIVMKNYIPTPTQTVNVDFVDGEVEIEDGITYFYAKTEAYGMLLALNGTGAGTYGLEDILAMNSAQGSYFADMNTKYVIDIAGGTITLAADNSFTAQFISFDACQYNITFTPKKTAIENTSVDAVKAQKVIRDGQLVIIKNGVEYNALGTQL